MSAITTSEVTCCACATRFSVDDALLGLRQKDGGMFYCPNGHAQVFMDTHATRLNKANAQLNEAQNEVRDLKIEITRLKCELVNARQGRGLIASLFKK